MYLLRTVSIFSEVLNAVPAIHRESLIDKLETTLIIGLEDAEVDRLRDDLIIPDCTIRLSRNDWARSSNAGGSEDKKGGEPHGEILIKAKLKEEMACRLLLHSMSSALLIHLAKVGQVLGEMDPVLPNSQGLGSAGRIKFLL